MDRAWLEQQLDDLLRVAAGSAMQSGGFGWLTDDGGIDPTRGVQTWITCRMTYVFAVAQAAGRPVTDSTTSAYDLVELGLDAISEPLRDRRHGGWWASASSGDDGRKGAYDQAFVLLALAAAATTGHDRAVPLLDEAIDVTITRFWDDDAGAVRESWDADWRETEDYRGANANMHMVEAFLALARATSDQVWISRARRITDKMIADVAAAHGFMLPEHFDSSWQPIPGYNADDPAHQFRPFGVTIGHLFEWARLCVQVGLALGSDAPPILLSNARRLFDRAVEVGWAADGAAGFIYTVDWDGRPVTRERLHWVIAEALGAAAVLETATGEQEYADRQAAWWDYARDFFADGPRGWRHELAPDGRPAAAIWQGRPDVYHPVQAILLTLDPRSWSLVPDRSGS